MANAVQHLTGATKKRAGHKCSKAGEGNYYKNIILAFSLFLSHSICGCLRGSILFGLSPFITLYVFERTRWWSGRNGECWVVGFFFCVCVCACVCFGGIVEFISFTMKKAENNCICKSNIE